MNLRKSLEVGCPYIMQNNYSDKVNYGGFFVRLAAYAIDCLVAGALLLFVRLIMWMSSFFIGSVLDFEILFDHTVKDVILYLCTAAYFIILTYFTGTTVGKRLMNLQVVSVNGEKLTFLNVLYRETVGRFLSAVVLNIGYIMMGIDKEKRGLHDILCNTRVVYQRKIKVVPVMPQAAPVSYQQMEHEVIRTEEREQSHDETGGF